MPIASSNGFSFPLDILDQRHRQRRIIRHAAHQHRNMVKPANCAARQRLSTGDNFIAVIRELAHQNWLHDSLGFN